ncbi:MAG: type II toxin-antitoxin system VapC family toxin [Armatimonadetes bacterium]|nr:type II toxin-antitoxin system VapC family toxin [Armatimonadota bacterium]MDW8029925.1 type II toxin-antitoxin system VapC family toxin [Armatimonadota bacterium]
MVAKFKTQEKIVVNASVFLATILLDEPIEVRLPATLMLARIEAGFLEAHIPDRFEDEVLGGLVEAFTKGRPLVTTFETVVTALEHFLAIANVHCRGVNWQAQEVLKAALRWRVSYYDAIYLTIAQEVSATYWTADKKLFRFLMRQGFTDLPKVGWIGSFT